MNNTIEEIIRKLLINKFVAEEEDVTPEASLENDLGMDSLDRVELIIEMEREFEITISDDLLEAANTVKDLSDIVINIQTPAAEKSPVSPPQSGGHVVG